MKIKKFLVLLPIIVGFCLFSCSEDEDGGYSKLDNQVNKVEFKVYSNTADVPINIEGAPDSFYLTIKNYWNTTFTTKDWGTEFDARCSDPTVLITGEIYINGKLKLRKEANTLLHMYVVIKGEPI